MRSLPSLVNNRIQSRRPAGPLRPSEFRTLNLVQRALQGNQADEHKSLSDAPDSVPLLSPGTARRASSGHVQYIVDL